MSNWVKFGITASAVAVASFAFAEVDYASVGRDATTDEVAAWDHDVRPDGLGLPEGSGSVEMGEEVYVENCAVCHGDFAEGAGRWPELAGGIGTLTSDDPVKTIGSYWPYLSTVWDYINEAMPFGNAKSLTNDEIYGITAFLMYSNDLVDYDFVLSKENFQDIRLPNEDGFIFDDRDTAEVPLFSAEACMSDCVDGELAIVHNATNLEVTPYQGVEGQGGVSSDADNDTAIAAAAANAALAEAQRGEVAEEPAEEESPATEEAPVEEGAALDVDPELVAKGEKVFKKCQACHKVGEGAKNATGPELNGIYTRGIAALDDFKYSKAMGEFAAENGQWTTELMAGFLADPKGYLKGTKMTFAGLKEKDIAAVEAFLQTQ